MHEQAISGRHSVCTSVLEIMQGAAWPPLRVEGRVTTKPLKILVRLPQEDDVDAISDVVLSCPYLDEAMLVMYSSCE